MNGLQLLKAEMKAILSNKRLLVPIIAVAFIPLLYAGMFLWAFWDPYGKMEHLPVAIVNEDKGAEMDGKALDIGGELSTKLKESEQFDFHFVSKKEAVEGLKNHDYYIAVEIPKSFSKKATTLLDEKPEKLEMYFLPNESFNFLAGQIGGTAVDRVKSEVASEITKTYADAMFEGINKASDGLAKAGDGAGELSDGLSTAKKGTNELSAGASLLASKQQEMKAGTSEMKSGAEALAAGSSTLAQKSGELSDGLGKLSDGSQSLSGGLGQLSAGQEALTSGAERLNGGLSTAKGGATQLRDGLATLAKGQTQLAEGTSSVTQGAVDLKDGALKLQTGNHQLASGLAAVETEVANNRQTLAAQLGALIQKGQPVDTATLQAIAGQLDQGNEKLSSALGQLSDAAAQLDDGAGRLADGAGKLADGTAQVDAGAKSASAGTDRLLAGADKLVSGVAELESGSGELASGLDKASGATLQLADGANRLSSGLNEASGGGAKLADGASEVSIGTSKLAQATEQVDDGAGKLASGAQDVASGTKRLDSGLTKLEDGASTLAAKLIEGADESALKTTDATKEMFAKPVKVVDAPVTEVPNYGTGFAPYFISLGLYVGALMLSIVYPMFDPAGRPKRTLSWLLSKSGVLALVGVFQSVFVAVLMRHGLGIEVAQPVTFYLFTFLVSLTFLLMIQFLVTVFGNPGRFIAVLLLILQLTSSAGTFPVELVPEQLKIFNTLLPMTYSVAGYKTVISGDAANFLHSAYGVLGLYSIGSLTFLYLYFRLQWKKRYKGAAAEEAA